MADTLMRSPDLGSAELTSTRTGPWKVYSDTEIKNNIVGKTKFTPYRYQLGDSRGYCEVHQEISLILVKYPVTTGILQGMADVPALWFKSTGR